MTKKLPIWATLPCTICGNEFYGKSTGIDTESPICEQCEREMAGYNRGWIEALYEVRKLLETMK